MARLFIYVVDRDFGFAPNPFHGCCTLATCKPRLRRSAAIGDWIVGMGGSRLRATGRCIFAMRVDQKTTFNAYWSDRKFRVKRPVRNGSKSMMVGDNIYHFDGRSRIWRQADSHHSSADGSPNLDNLRNDTQVDSVLISRWFFYFGRNAPLVPKGIMRVIGYRNHRGYRVFDLEGDARTVIEWLDLEFRGSVNSVVADPYDFEASAARYSVKTNRVLA